MIVVDLTRHNNEMLLCDAVLYGEQRFTRPQAFDLSIWWSAAIVVESLNIMHHMVCPRRDVDGCSC